MRSMQESMKAGTFQSRKGRDFSIRWHWGNCKKRFFDCWKPGKCLARTWHNHGRNLVETWWHNKAGSWESGAGTSFAETWWICSVCSFFLPHISANLTGMLLPSLLGGRLLDQGQNHDFHLVSGESFLYSQSQAYSYIYIYISASVCTYSYILSWNLTCWKFFIF